MCHKIDTVCVPRTVLVPDDHKSLTNYVTPPMSPCLVPCSIVAAIGGTDVHVFQCVLRRCAPPSLLPKALLDVVGPEGGACVSIYKLYVYVNHYHLKR